LGKRLKGSEDQRRKMPMLLLDALIQMQQLE